MTYFPIISRVSSNIHRQLSHEIRNSMRRAEYGPLKICGALRNLVAFVQFKKREKHPWRSVNTPPWVLTLLHG